MGSEPDEGGSGEPPIKAEVGAKYERKTEVSIVVPEDVTRAKAKAFLDAISPFTSSLGLVGDWVSDTRERLRLHRLAALTEVAKKAQAALDRQGKVDPGKIPFKALLPILERASLEQSDDEVLTSAWGALIASASLDYDPEVIVFSRILSELGPRECVVLDRIFGNRSDWASGEEPPASMRRFFENEGLIKPAIRTAVPSNDLSIFGKLREYVDPSLPMEFTVAYTRKTSQRANWIDKRLKEPFYADNELAYRMLEIQGLAVGRGQGYSWQDGEVPVGIDWIELSNLGRRFVSRTILPFKKKVRNQRR